jgi:hypothetical protein
MTVFLVSESAALELTAAGASAHGGGQRARETFEGIGYDSAGLIARRYQHIQDCDRYDRQENTCKIFDNI